MREDTAWSSMASLAVASSIQFVREKEEKEKKAHCHSIDTSLLYSGSLFVNVPS
jgi:hypothetical protein